MRGVKRDVGRSGRRLNRLEQRQPLGVNREIVVIEDALGERQEVGRAIGEMARLGELGFDFRSEGDAPDPQVIGRDDQVENPVRSGRADRGRAVDGKTAAGVHRDRGRAKRRAAANLEPRRQNRIGIGRFANPRDGTLGSVGQPQNRTGTGIIGRAIARRGIRIDDIIPGVAGLEHAAGAQLRTRGEARCVGNGNLRLAATYREDQFRGRKIDVGIHPDLLSGDREPGCSILLVRAQCTDRQAVRVQAGQRVGGQHEVTGQIGVGDSARGRDADQIATNVDLAADAAGRRGRRKGACYLQ